MRTFIHGTDQQFAELERNALGSCVVFPDQEMPPGTTPARARVGCEVRPNGQAGLYVDRRMIYDGPCQAVRDWYALGVRWFPAFSDLRRWVTTELAALYPSRPPAPVPTPMPSLPSEPTRPVEQLTDLARVRQALPPVPEAQYLDPEALYLDLIHRVRGQEHSLRRLADRVCRHVARKQPSRPGSLLLTGPTGVGKTTAAQALARCLAEREPSGHGWSFLRLDMAEYQEKHRVGQLLGAPQGYVGYGDGAQLPDALRANPRTVVLFDEIEKAHPDVLRALMHALDAGRLSSAANGPNGREIDCRSALFLFTSNLDSSTILADLEFRDGFDDPAVVDEVCRQRLRGAGVAPELIGRIGAFLVFRPLTPEVRAEIAAQAFARVAQEYGLRLGHIAPELIVRILEESPRADFGARPDEYRIDEIFGGLFAAAAARRLTDVQLVAGPPVAVLALEPDEFVDPLVEIPLEAI